MTENELDLTVFVACYNEEANIVGALDTLREALRDLPLTWEAIIIDDGSRDRSVAVIEKYIRENPTVPLRLVINEHNRGLAQNYIEGAFLGRGKYYRLVCGDNVEDAGQLRTVFSQVGAADMVLFYHAENYRTPFRKKLSSTYTRIINFLTGHQIRYYNGCALHLRYNVMRWHTNYHGFGFQADMVCRLLDEGFSYTEVPVKAVERATGHSKALTIKNLLSVSHTLLDLFIRRVARAMYRKKRQKPRWHERFDLYPDRAFKPVAEVRSEDRASAVGEPVLTEGKA